MITMPTRAGSPWMGYGLGRATTSPSTPITPTTRENRKIPIRNPRTYLETAPRVSNPSVQNGRFSYRSTQIQIRKKMGAKEKKSRMNCWSADFSTGSWMGRLPTTAPKTKAGIPPRIPAPNINKKLKMIAAHNDGRRLAWRARTNNRLDGSNNLFIGVNYSVSPPGLVRGMGG